MEVQVPNLYAEKAKDGNIYIYFTDGQLSEYRVCVAIIEGDFIKWETQEGVVRRAII